MKVSDFQWRVTIVVILLLVTVLAVNRIQTVGVAPLESADVLAELPSRVQDWQGQGIRYCQNEMCARSFLVDELKGVPNCPVCQSPLADISVGERTLLPSDTVLVRKVYRSPAGDEIVVTIVITGNEQRSIHRPQQCLPAQGFEVKSTSRESVPMIGRKPLVMTVIFAVNGRSGTALAYWFLGGGHETHDHFQRLAWMAWDNLFRNVRPRWAYVSLQTPSVASDQVAGDRLAEFARQLYPLLKSNTHNHP